MSWSQARMASWGVAWSRTCWRTTWMWSRPMRSGRAGHLSDLGVPLMHADLTDLGEAMDVVAGVDAVVHLANIPAPGMETAGGHLHAQRDHELPRVPCRDRCCGVQRVVWASSETTLGLPFDIAAPVRAHRRGALPAADEHVCPVQGRDRDAGGADVSMVRASRSSPSGSRTSWPSRTTPRFPSYQADAQLRSWNLWSYIDLRDAAAACRLALTAAGHRCPQLHHRERRHRHGAADRGPAAGGVPGRAGAG